MKNNNEINMNLKITKKNVTIGLAVVVAISLIVPYQIFAQKQASPEQAAPEPDQSISAIPTGTCVAWASNEIQDKSSWYAIMCRASIAGNVKSVDINFPDTYDVSGTGTEPISQSGLKAGDLSSGAGAMLTYTLSGTPRAVAVGATFKLIVGHIINPSPGIPSTYSVQVTTKNDVGTVIEALPATAPVALELVDSLEILNGSIAAADIANAAITQAKLANNAVTTLKIRDGEVKNPDLGSDIVDSTKILDSSVMAPDIAFNAISGDHILDSTIEQGDVSPSFIKIVQLNDDASGNAAGWNPNDIASGFTIIDSAVTLRSVVAISYVVHGDRDCSRTTVNTGQFAIICTNPPLNNDSINYAVFTPES